VANKGAVVRGLKQLKKAGIPNTSGDMGGFMSPYMATSQQPSFSYNDWMQGRIGTLPLPRPPEDFATAAFGPLAPIIPIGVDEASESGRPEPRRWQYQVGWNMPIGQPGSEGLKLTSFATLRAYADMYSIIRAAIQLRKDEILGLQWDIQPTEAAEKSMRGDTGAHADFQQRRATAIQFFNHPDPNYHDFQSWMNAVLEDLFVVDALTIYLHPSRVPGRGLFGTDLASLDALDGTTIRPLLDIRGGVPRPPAVAFQQYLWGVPRSDFIDVILETDLEYVDEPVAEFRGDQLLYLPYNRRTWTPYGFPGIERALIPVVTGLKKQQYALDFFSEGSIPGIFVTPGQDLTTPQQWKQLQDRLNALEGDQAYKHKAIVLPPGSDVKPQRPPELASMFDEQVAAQVLMAYDVTPMEVGISPRATMGMTTGQSNQMQKSQNEALSSPRKSLKPLLYWLKRCVFDFVLQELCGQDDLSWKWVGLDDEEREDIQADATKTLVSLGIKSIDEVRTEMGLNPWGLPLTSDPIFVGTAGPIPMGTITPGTDPEADATPIATAQQFASAPQTMAPPAVPGQTPPGTADQGGSPITSTVPTPPSGMPPNAAVPPGPNIPMASVNPVATRQPAHNQSASPLVFRAMYDELRDMRRVLRKGRDLSSWQVRDLPEDLFKTLSRAAEVRGWESALTSGRAILKAQGPSGRQAQSEEAVSGAYTSLVPAIQAATTAHHAGVTSAAEFVKTVLAVLTAVLRAAAQHGIGDAANEYGFDASDVNVDPDALAVAKVKQQTSYVQKMAQDAKDGDVSDDRIALYSGLAHTVYEQAFGKAVHSAASQGLVSAVGSSLVSKSTGGSDPVHADDLRLIWHKRDDEACDLCTERNGHVYKSLADLPGWPGEGTFGQLCEGGPQCRCWVEYQNGNELSQAKAAAVRPLLAKDAPNPPSVIASGVVLKANDTGRVLMLQRAIDAGDEAAGKWEWPGGHIEDGESPQDAAVREFEEETGCKFPKKAQYAGSVIAPNGIYESFIYVIKREAKLPINTDPDNRAILNPDDPDNDAIETAAWFDPDHIPDNPAVRPEVTSAPWKEIEAASYSDKGDKTVVAYRGVSPEFAAGLQPGALLTDPEPTAATFNRALMVTEAVIAKIHVPCDWPQRAGFVKLPGGTVFKVLAIREGEIELEAS
jgi:8-oxo-dGTP pyrophosphatase MutT (NUDIX family)